MDYKGKYEMALEGIQEILGSGEDSIKMSRLQLRLQGIFPELKESEDERIRKSIIELLNEVHFTFKYYDINKMLAWLEKQCEQKPAEWSEEDEKILSNIIKDLVHPWNEYIPDRIEDEIKWLKNKLKSLRPQNQLKLSDEQIESLQESIGIVGELTPRGELLKELAEQLKKLREE